MHAKCEKIALPKQSANDAQNHLQVSLFCAYIVEFCLNAVYIYKYIIILENKLVLFKHVDILIFKIIIFMKIVFILKSRSLKHSIIVLKKNQKSSSKKLF